MVPLSPAAPGCETQPRLPPSPTETCLVPALLSAYGHRFLTHENQTLAFALFCHYSCLSPGLSALLQAPCSHLGPSFTGTGCVLLRCYSCQNHLPCLQQAEQTGLAGKLQDYQASKCTGDSPSLLPQRRTHLPFGKYPTTVVPVTNKLMPVNARAILQAEESYMLAKPGPTHQAACLS